MNEVLAGLAVGGAGLLLMLPGRPGRRRMARLRTGRSRSGRALAHRLVATVTRSARTGIALAAAAGAALGLSTAGPVAALVGASYAGFVTYLLFRRRAARRAAQIRSETLDAVTALADDLRAGLTPVGALSHVWPRLIGVDAPPTESIVPADPPAVLDADREPARADITRRLAVSWRLAGTTGAPLAALLDRLQTELIERERLRRTAAAQTAGNRVTAAMLALLPLAGIGLGYAIGADPLNMLWHTAIGAGCAVVALSLQGAGVAWTLRLTRPEPGVRA